MILQDLEGKVVNIGNPGSGQRGTMEELMKAMGVDNSFFKSVTELTSSEQVKALCDGKIDALWLLSRISKWCYGASSNLCSKSSFQLILVGGPVQGLIRWCRLLRSKQ